MLHVEVQLSVTAQTRAKMLLLAWPTGTGIAQESSVVANHAKEYSLSVPLPRAACTHRC